MRRFSQTTGVSASDGLVYSAQGKLSFASDAIREDFADCRGESLGSSPFVSPPDEVPLYRLGLKESEADSEDEAEDSMDGAQKIWRDIKVKTYGSGDGGSIGRVKFSTDVNRNSGAEGGGTGSGAESKSQVMVREVRETDFALEVLEFCSSSHLRLCLIRRPGYLARY